MIGQKLFPNQSGQDARTAAQQELAELTDCQRLLGMEFNFSDAQRSVIEKTFTQADWEEIRGAYEAAWRSVAERAVPVEMKSLRQQLGLPEVESVPKRNTKPEPEEVSVDQPQA